LSGKNDTVGKVCKLPNLTKVVRFQHLVGKEVVVTEVDRNASNPTILSYGSGSISGTVQTKPVKMGKYLQPIMRKLIGEYMNPHRDLITMSGSIGNMNPLAYRGKAGEISDIDYEREELIFQSEPYGNENSHHDVSIRRIPFESVGSVERTEVYDNTPNEPYYTMPVIEVYAEEEE